MHPAISWVSRRSHMRLWRLRWPAGHFPHFRKPPRGALAKLARMHPCPKFCAEFKFSNRFSKFLNGARPKSGSLFSLPRRNRKSRFSRCTSKCWSCPRNSEGCILAPIFALNSNSDTVCPNSGPNLGTPAERHRNSRFSRCTSKRWSCP